MGIWEFIFLLFNIPNNTLLLFEASFKFIQKNIKLLFPDLCNNMRVVNNIITTQYISKFRLLRVGCKYNPKIKMVKLLLNYYSILEICVYISGIVIIAYR